MKGLNTLFYGRRGIAPIFKKCIKSFCMHKTELFLTIFPFLSDLLKWVQFRVGAIPSEQVLCVRICIYI